VVGVVAATVGAGGLVVVGGSVVVVVVVVGVVVVVVGGGATFAFGATVDRSRLTTVSALAWARSAVFNLVAMLSVFADFARCAKAFRSDRTCFSREMSMRTFAAVCEGRFAFVVPASDAPAETPAVRHSNPTATVTPILRTTTMAILHSEPGDNGSGAANSTPLL
jgi:hypothetical protein